MFKKVLKISSLRSAISNIFVGVYEYTYMYPLPPPLLNEGGQLSSSCDELPTYHLQGSSRLVVQCEVLLSGSIS